MRFYLQNIGRCVWLLTLLLSTVACQQEEWEELSGGTLHFSIGQTSTHSQTRMTPAELGKPVAEMFRLNLQRVGSNHTTYEGKFIESLEVPVGEYEITATCGENVVIGRDTPYYIGTARATVEADKASAVSIPCKVGNALVSVKFGRDEAEQQRFDRFYEEYALLVRLGEYSMSIGKAELASSIYFPAGSSPELVFLGTLKNDNGRVVSKVLTHEALPTVFQAADHAIVTISLPDPQSAAVLKIEKVELVEARLDETIPLSWLPVPGATATHQYNEQGVLMGTNVTFTNTYPEMTWEARVSNEQADTVRIVKGEGALLSAYATSNEWPYLPAGKYKATYFLHTEDGVNKVSSREFVVASPKIEAKVNGYTSYSLYEEGRIADANTADGHTLYEPQVSVNIAPALIALPKYAYSLSYTFDGQTESVNTNAHNLGQKKLDARMNTYNLSMDVRFAGEQASATKAFRITGIPFAFEPPTTTTWEKDGDVTDEGEYARMGRWNGGSQSLTYRKVALPAGIRLALDYKFIPNAGIVATTLTIYAGEQALVSGKADSYQQPTYEGVQAVTLTSDATEVRCYNSYGAGNTGTDVYRVAMRYRE